MYLYTAKESNRLRYIVNTLLARPFGIEVHITTDAAVFNSATVPKINYSTETFENCIQIVPHAILFDFGIKDYLIEVHGHDRFQKYFFRNTKGHIPFDLFGASFWLLSRYEEYLPFKANKYNVFDYRSSLAWQNNFLEIPLVNCWIEEFLNIITSNYPGFQFATPDFKSTVTIDIDNVFKYKHKGVVRSLAGIMNDVAKRQFKQLKERIQTIFFHKLDEFDCYPFLIQSNKTFHSKIIYFFLLGDYGVNDKNHPSSNLKFQELIKHLADYGVAGIHPSFASNFAIQQLKIEIVRLSSITHKEVTCSRQHFGMLTFPKTFEWLLQSGIKHDYSLGYTNANGFRASYCLPYRWYNISEELETALTIHPFCMNDVALQRSRGASNNSIVQKIEDIIQTVKKYSGEFIIVFHNDMLSNTPEGLEWRKIYSHTINYLNPLLK